MLQLAATTHKGAFGNIRRTAADATRSIEDQNLISGAAVTSHAPLVSASISDANHVLRLISLALQRQAPELREEKIVHKLIRVIFGIIVWSGSAVPAIAQADAIKRQYVLLFGLRRLHTASKTKALCW